jgi:hypothetical protein
MTEFTTETERTYDDPDFAPPAPEAEAPVEPLPQDPPATPVAKAKAAYIVLRESGNTWIEAGIVNADGPADARKQVAKQIYEGGYEESQELKLVAVSARFWQPKTLRPRASWDVSES